MVNMTASTSITFMKLESQEKKKERCRKKIFKEILAEIFSDLIKKSNQKFRTLSELKTA